MHFIYSITLLYNPLGDSSPLFFIHRAISRLLQRAYNYFRDREDFCNWETWLGSDYLCFIYCIVIRSLLRGAWRAMRSLRRIPLGLRMTFPSRARHRQCECLDPCSLLRSFWARFRIRCLSPRMARAISSNSFRTRRTFVLKISWGLKRVSSCNFDNRKDTSFCFCASKQSPFLPTSYLKHQNCLQWWASTLSTSRMELI